MEQIGAYYQCYINKKSLEFVLMNYRKEYPDNSIVLVCDGGIDFTEESIKYRCNYIHDEKIETKKNLIFKNKESAKRFIGRISDNIHLINENFFILLEDDVYVMKKIKSDLYNDINGCNKNEFFSSGLASIIRERNKNLGSKIYYGAFGGCILRTYFFKEILADKSKVEHDLDIYFNNSNPDEWASDKILTYLCLINNGTIGHYTGLSEMWYPDITERIGRNEVEVLHQYKEHY